MYVTPNFKTKKSLKEAIQKGDEVRVYSPGPFAAKTNGIETIEGPHFPEAHKWYARVQVENHRVMSVLK